MIRAYRQGLNDAIGKVVRNPFWSEEDKDMLENILGTYKTLEDMLDLSTEQDQDILTSMNFERVWLKSLKQRIGG